MQLSFESSYLKVQRARKHLLEIQNELQDFSRSDFCELEIRPLNDGTSNISLTVTKALPQSIALTIGDTLHNLRSSLDHLFSEILIHYGVPTNRYQFPIINKSDELEKCESFLILKKHSAKAITLLSDAIQPYETGNYKLWALSKLNNIDKHRLLLVFGQGTATGLEGTYIDGSPFGVMFANIRDMISQPNIATVSKHVANITKFNLPSIQAFFGKNGYFDDHPVDFVLNELLVEVELTITKFKAINY
ncbi:hypothetical protein [Methylotenera sp. N17]|uniref:hypothetical protein n=1 Tax=Methylotenera sp. N17 TaxID=1502761 RepID=UPI000A493B9B|nr:hypothetical protein [Methylotenera sp. N17]